VIRRSAILAVLLLAAPVPAAAQPSLDLAERVDADDWTLVAVEYARSDGVSVGRLVRGPVGGARVDMSWYFFVAVGHGRVVLVDVGTDALARGGRHALRERWSIERAVPVTEALARVGLEPSEVTDVVLTHHHWDHVGALGRFDEARVHVHSRDWPRVAARLREPVEESDRLRLVEGERADVAPGLSVRHAGAHTPGQLTVRVACGEREVVIVGDAAYLYRNVEERRPVTVTVDRDRNVADVAAAVESVGAEDVLPGHDPALFERHPSDVDGVALVCRGNT